MSIQKSINAGISTVGGAIALGKHLANQAEATAQQAEELKIKKAEALEGLTNTENEIAREQAKDYTINQQYKKETQEEFMDRKAQEAKDKMMKASESGDVTGLEEGYKAFQKLKGLRAAKAKFKFILGDKDAFNFQDNYKIGGNK